MKKFGFFKLIVIVFLSFSLQLYAQLKNKNEYIKLNDEFFCQYSPIDKGWAIFKLRNSEFIKQEYYITRYLKKSNFEKIFVVSESEFYIYNDKEYKQIILFKNELKSNGYKEIIIYNSPQTNSRYPHTVGLTFENEFVSLHDFPIVCDTFVLQNGIFFPIFKKDNPNFLGNIFTQDGLIIPTLYGNSNYYYSIKKTSQGYILSNRMFFKLQNGFQYTHIPAYPEISSTYRNRELNKLFKSEVMLSYYNKDCFLISLKNKWYICKVPMSETNLNEYLSDIKRVLPKNKDLYQYFGTIEANSIRILSWVNGIPEYFVANINGIDYLYNYQKAKIKNIDKNITFPKAESIQGNLIRAYYPPINSNGNHPMYIEVQNGPNASFYRYTNNSFVRYNENPFIGNFKSTFIGSTYKEFNNNGKVVSEKTFKAFYTPSEMEDELKIQAEEEEKLKKEKNRIFVLNLKQTNGIRNNCFPKKYFDCTNFFSKEYDNHTIGPYVVINQIEKKINIPEIRGFIALGKSGSEEGFQLISSGSLWSSDDHGESLLSTALPNIKSNLIQALHLSRSSYDMSLYLSTISYSINQDNAISIATNNLKLEDIFLETGLNYKYPLQNVYFLYDNVDFRLKNALRLSNNNILLIWENNIEFLSNQLNSALGIDGYGYISRTFKQAKYYKFLVISEDGSQIILNKNFIIPESNESIFSNYIISVDSGFILCLSPCKGDLISLDISDFGIKKTIFSNAEGKNIIVTENINLTNNSSTVEGIKFYKFDNDCNLQIEKTIDGTNDNNIELSKLDFIYAFDDKFLIDYTSYHAKVMNFGISVTEYFDFNLNSISKIIYEDD